MECVTKCVASAPSQAAMPSGTAEAASASMGAAVLS